jgi:gp16 family phage-associated protein
MVKATNKVARTVAALRADLRSQGITLAGWARTHGFHIHNVQDVVGGRNQGRNGEGHKIAIGLGLKVGRAGTTTPNVRLGGRPRRT